jgi:hypothetical protein
MKEEIMNRKIAFLAILIVLVITLPIQAAPWVGSGDPNDPYLIFDANDMQAIGADSSYWDSHFKLISDIDLSCFTGRQFNIIGDMTTPFTGVFDGENHTIYNFTYSGTNQGPVGMFGFVDSPTAQIKDLVLIDPNIMALPPGSTGSLVGVFNQGAIINCGAENVKVEGYQNVGGLIGTSKGSVIRCYVDGEILGSYQVGGFVAWNSGNILQCQASVAVTGGSYTGGLVGINSRDVSISESFSRGIVSGYEKVGGFVGYNKGYIANCYTTADVHGIENIGGLVGRSRDRSISNSYSIGRVNSAGTYVGGLVGRLYSGTVSNSFWDVIRSGCETGSVGIGLTTTQMQDPNTFIDAGWDFITPIWIMCNEGEYPKLWWQGCNTPPVAFAGKDQVVYACVGVMAEIKLDGSGSYDADGDELTYLWSWIVDSNEMTATGVDPNIQLPVGEHTIELIVNDRTEDSEPNEVVITVVGPIEADVHIVPRVINRRNRMKRIMAIIRLPEGILKQDIADEPFVLEPGQIEAIWDRVIGRGNQATVFALFNKDEVMAALPNTGSVELTVIGKLKSGQCISGTDTIRIVEPRRRTRGLRRR